MMGRKLNKKTISSVWSGSWEGAEVPLQVTSQLFLPSSNFLKKFLIKQSKRKSLKIQKDSREGRVTNLMVQKIRNKITFES